MQKNRYIYLKNSILLPNFSAKHVLVLILLGGHLEEDPEENLEQATSVDL